jgi:hypothetical protein
MKGALRHATQGINSGLLGELFSQFPIAHAARNLLLA